jgi:hypothetical protein
MRKRKQERGKYHHKNIIVRSLALMRMTGMVPPLDDTTPCMTDVTQSTKKWLNDSGPEVDPSTWKLNDSRGMASKFTKPQCTMSWCHMP